MLDEHWGYVADPARVERYGAAIGSVVAPGHVVADLGCGSGILTLLALKAGAAHVYAVDDSRMLAIAREAVGRAGLAARVSFIHGRSQKVDLPQRVDVVLCDHVGWFGFDYDIARLLADARRRFLKEGGACVPQALALEVAAVESERCRALAERWGEGAVPAAFHWLRDSSVNSKHSVELAVDELLGPAATLGTLDLGEDHPEFMSWSARPVIERAGVLHGVAGWFDCELVPGTRMTNSPRAPGRINRPQVFLPIAEPVAVGANDAVEVAIMARPSDHLLAWEIRVGDRHFRHSTWQGLALAPEDLVRANPHRIPKLSREGVARSLVLAYCDGKRTVREIEEAVLRDHPALFPSAAEISRFVVEVLGRETAL